MSYKIAVCEANLNLNLFCMSKDGIILIFIECTQCTICNRDHVERDS